MPILEVTVVGEAPADAAQRVADAAGAILGAPPGEAWVRIERVAPADYAESGGAIAGPGPVIVRVLRFELPSIASRAASMSSLASAIGEALGRPRERVHVIAEPAGAGRVAFGGELLPGSPRHRAASGAKWESIVGYSRAVRVGDLVWVTGTTSFGEGGARVGEGDAYAQARQAIANLERALIGLGSGLRDVVRTRMFVTDIARDWEAIGRAHAEAFGAVRPATTMVEVRALIEDWMLVEIEADATLGG